MSRRHTPYPFAAATPNDAPRRRTTQTLSDPLFIRTKAHALEIFQREVRK